jgi:hypothetical protein
MGRICPLRNRCRVRIDNAPGLCAPIIRRSLFSRVGRVRRRSSEQHMRAAHMHLIPRVSCDLQTSCTRKGCRELLRFPQAVRTLGVTLFPSASRSKYKLEPTASQKQRGYSRNQSGHQHLFGNRVRSKTIHVEWSRVDEAVAYQRATSAG